MTSETPALILPTSTVDLGNWKLTATATPAGDRVDVFVAIDFVDYDPVLPDWSRDPRFVEGVMVWLNGEYVVHSHNYQTPEIRRLGHTWVDSPGAGQPGVRRWEHTISINRRAVSADAPGPAKVTVALFDSGWKDSQFGIPIGQRDRRGIVHVSLPVTLPPLTPARQSVHPAAYLRCLFQCNPSELTAADRQAVQDAGANAFEVQLFRNPRTTPTTYAQWQADWESSVGASLQLAADMGMLVVGCGDDFARDQAAYEWMRDTSWAADAVAYVSRRCKEFGHVACLEVQDEVGVSAIDDPVYQKVRAAWTSVSGYVPMGWPTRAVEDNRPLEVPQWADYVTRYIDPNRLTWKGGLADNGTTGWQCAEDARRQAATIARGRAFMVNATCNGPNYRKYSEGGEFNPAGDLLHRAGNRPDEIVFQCWVNASVGATGVRLFKWDSHPEERANASTNGDRELFAGSRPGDGRWLGVVAAMSSLRDHEALLLGPYHGHQTQGPWLVGRWDGLTAWCNSSEVAQSLPAPGTLVTGAGLVSFAGGDVPPLGVVLIEG